ncbi:ribonuclease H-like domain-containing protein [Tanacetum coccineum]
MSTSSNTTFEFDVNHNGEFKLNPLTYQHGSLLNIYVPQMGFEDMVSYLKWKIPRQFNTLYYMLPPNYALSGMKQIKNDYHTNVMYDIAKVAGKLQIFVAHTPIDLSTVLIPNDGSFKKSLAGVISEETKIKLEESLKYLHQMQKRKNKKFDYYGLWGELGIIRQETQNDYTSDQMVEWAEQEHFEYEETKVSCPKIDLRSMLIHNNRSKEESFGDADWAGCPVTRRSTFGYCVFLGDNLLSWSAKRQVTLSRSSAEAKYCGVANVVAETVWIRNLLLELHALLTTATLVYCDNVSSVYLSTNPVQHQRTKHIEIDIHFVRDYIASGQVRVLHVSSRFQYESIFTKGLPSALFLEFRSSLNIRRSPVPTAGEY